MKTTIQRRGVKKLGIIRKEFADQFQLWTAMIGTFGILFLLSLIYVDVRLSTIFFCLAGVSVVIRRTLKQAIMCSSDAILAQHSRVILEEILTKEFADDSLSWAISRETAALKRLYEANKSGEHVTERLKANVEKAERDRILLKLALDEILGEQSPKMPLSQNQKHHSEMPKIGQTHLF